jgi:hypothetical protein
MRAIVVPGCCQSKKKKKKKTHEEIVERNRGVACPLDLSLIDSTSLDKAEVKKERGVRMPSLLLILERKASVATERRW